jgi:hypothetical protein
MAGELKVVIVDDDEWKREGMAARLDATKEVDVVASVDQDRGQVDQLDRGPFLDRNRSATAFAHGPRECPRTSEQLRLANCTAARGWLGAI